MLVVVRIDTWVDFGTKSPEILAWIHSIGIQDTGEFDIQLNGSILVEYPVYTVLVVGGSKNLGDNQFSRAGHNDRIITEIGVFEQCSCIFLVNADCVFDGSTGTGSVHERGIHVVDSALAVTAEGQTVRHISTTILTEIERMLSLVGMIGVSVRNDHLSKGESVKHGADIAPIIKRDVVEDNAFFVVEAHVDVPFLPVDDPTVNFERYSLGLSDMNGFNIIPVAALFLYCLCVIVAWGSFVNHPPDRRNIDMDNLLLFGVIDGTEVQWERILAIIRVGSIVHQRLLQADTCPKAFIIANCPSCSTPISSCYGNCLCCEYSRSQ